MANIDKLIINDPSASEPTNPLEMYVAKINGTYTGDIPEPTNDLEKALAQVAAGGGGGGSAAKWPKLKIKYDGEGAQSIPLGYPTSSGIFNSVDPYTNDGHEAIIPATYIQALNREYLYVGSISLDIGRQPMDDLGEWSLSVSGSADDLGAGVGFKTDGLGGTPILAYNILVSSLSDIPTITLRIEPKMN